MASQLGWPSWFKASVQKFLGAGNSGGGAAATSSMIASDPESAVLKIGGSNPSPSKLFFPFPFLFLLTRRRET